MNQQGERSAFEFLKNWGDGLTLWSEKWIPDALVIVWILSFIAFALALIWGDATTGRLRCCVGKRLLGAAGIWYADVLDHDDRVHSCMFRADKTDYGRIGFASQS